MKHYVERIKNLKKRFYIQAYNKSKAMLDSQPAELQGCVTDSIMETESDDVDLAIIEAAIIFKKKKKELENNHE